MREVLTSERIASIFSNNKNTHTHIDQLRALICFFGGTESRTAKKSFKLSLFNGEERIRTVIVAGNGRVQFIITSLFQFNIEWIETFGQEMNIEKSKLDDHPPPALEFFVELTFSVDYPMRFSSLAFL